MFTTNFYETDVTKDISLCFMQTFVSNNLWKIALSENKKRTCTILYFLVFFDILGPKNCQKKVEIRPWDLSHELGTEILVENAVKNASRSFFSTHFVKIWGHFGWIGVPGPACTVLGSNVEVVAEMSKFLPRRRSVQFGCCQLGR